MKIRVVLLVAFAALGLILSGCVSSDVISAGPDTFMVSASGVGFATAGVREDVFKKANAYCESRGLVMVPVSLKVRPGALAQHPPSADLIFKALRPGDPAIGKTVLTGDDEPLASTQIIKVQVKDEDKKDAKVDTYTEILKLDDLRKRGLITDAEYEAGKKKLLEGK